MSQVVQVLKGELAVDVIVGPDGLWPPAQIPSNLMTLADSDSSTEESELLLICVGCFIVCNCEDRLVNWIVKIRLQCSMPFQDQFQRGYSSRIKEARRSCIRLKEVKALEGLILVLRAITSIFGKNL
ncbi:hypothetical protein SOVF_007790 [Spinacia oleracea]|nr:hypothetical protein SOVF_007790 [Spinacia oleracea]